MALLFFARRGCVLRLRLFAMPALVVMIVVMSGATATSLASTRVFEFSGNVTGFSDTDTFSPALQSVLETYLTTSSAFKVVIEYSTDAVQTTTSSPEQASHQNTGDLVSLELGGVSFAPLNAQNKISTLAQPVGSGFVFNDYELGGSTAESSTEFASALGLPNPNSFAVTFTYDRSGWNFLPSIDVIDPLSVFNMPLGDLPPVSGVVGNESLFRFDMEAAGEAGFARILSTDFAVREITEPIPVPPAFILFATIALGLVARRR